MTVVLWSNPLAVSGAALMVVAQRRVVVVEDESLIRLDLAGLLVKAGFVVVVKAVDGQQAVAVSRQLRPDLMVMDVRCLAWTEPPRT